MVILSEEQIEELAAAICEVDSPLLVTFPSWFYELSETEQGGAITKAIWQRCGVPLPPDLR